MSDVEPAPPIPGAETSAPPGSPWPAPGDPRSLVEHARAELERSGQTAQDPAYAASIVAAVAAFTSYRHSGGSASVAVEQLDTLLRRQTLAPLTSDPAEWADQSWLSRQPMWQNIRDPRAISNDGGQTWWYVEGVHAGERCWDGGQLGTLIRCDGCGGRGVLHQVEPGAGQTPAVAPPPEPGPLEEILRTQRGLAEAHRDVARTIAEQERTRWHRSEAIYEAHVRVVAAQRAFDEACQRRETPTGPGTEPLLAAELGHLQRFNTSRWPDLDTHDASPVDVAIAQINEIDRAGRALLAVLSDGTPHVPDDLIARVRSSLPRAATDEAAAR